MPTFQDPKTIVLGPLGIQHEPKTWFTAFTQPMAPRPRWTASPPRPSGTLRPPSTVSTPDTPSSSRSWSTPIAPLRGLSYSRWIEMYVSQSNTKGIGITMETHNLENWLRFYAQDESSILWFLASVLVLFAQCVKNNDLIACVHFPPAFLSPSLHSVIFCCRWVKLFWQKNLKFLGSLFFCSISLSWGIIEEFIQGVSKKKTKNLKKM